MYLRILRQSHEDLASISALCSKYWLSTGTNLVRPLRDFHSKEALADHLVPILQACCDRSLLSQARQVHAQFVVCDGLTHNCLVATKILAVYVLSRSFLDAKNLFHGLDLRFASPWNWMIRWFGTMGLFDLALRFYFKMLCHGALPDKYTFPSVIKACGGLRNIALAKMVHRKTEFMGLEVDVFVGSSLIKLYAEHGLIRSAREVFDKMPTRDGVLWNVMLRGYSKNGDPKSSVEMFLGLCKSNVKPNSVSFACMLSVCSSEELLHFGTQLHGKTVVSGLELDSPVANTLLAMYSKSQRLNNARKLFNLMPKTDTVTWNGMISGFVQSGSMAEASSCFRSMISSGAKPDPITFASFLPCVTESADLRRGKEIHGYVVRHGLNFDVFLKSALLDLYFKCRNPELARKVLEQSDTIDVIVCTAMISGYVLNGMSSDALSIFRRLLRERMRPNSVTLASVFPALAASAALKLGKELHAEILKSGTHDGKCFVESAVVDMYAKCGRLDLARRVFHRMPVRDAISWNTMITSCSQNGSPEEAIEYFRQMGSTETATKHDCVSVSAALSSCSAIPSLRLGREIHGFAIRTGLGSDAFFASSLVDMYAKCGRLDLARLAFDRHLSNEVAWNSMIAAYGAHGRLEECLALFRDMLRSGIAPDHVTFLGIMSACGHSGRVEEGVGFFRAMTREHGIRARAEHYACVVDLLGRAGRLREALAAIQSMPFRPDSGVWGTLLGACRVHKNVELAEVAARHLFDMEPRNSGYYVLLANVHANSGDWESVLRVRRLMKERGVQKVPGYSWIETWKETRVFVAGDGSHPESAEIYSVLNGLLSELRREGYVPLHPQRLTQVVS